MRLGEGASSLTIVALAVLAVSVLGGLIVWRVSVESRKEKRREIESTPSGPIRSKSAEPESVSDRPEADDAKLVRDRLERIKQKEGKS